MNFLHTSAQQRSPIRGVALRPLSGRAVDSASAKAVSPSLEALDAMKQDVSLLQRTLRSVLKATRTAARSSAVQAIAFVLVLFATVNVATAGTFYYVGSSGTAWNNASSWSATSGGTGGIGIPGSADIAIFDKNTGFVDLTNATILTVGRLVVQSGGSVIFRSPNNSVITDALQILGIGGDNTAPLVVNPNSFMTVEERTRINVTSNLGNATNAVSVFGTLTVSTGANVGAPVGRLIVSTTFPLFIDEGGTLSMAGGVVNASAIANQVRYSTLGARGTLKYSKAGTTQQFIPESDEIIAATVLGNLVVERPSGAINTLTLTGAAAYTIRGTLEVKGAPGIAVLTVPSNTTITMAASKMASGRLATVPGSFGNAFIAPFTGANSVNIIYDEPAAPAAGYTPLAATTSDVAFTLDQSAGSSLFGWVNQLRTNIPSLNVTINSDLQMLGTPGLTIDKGKITVPMSRTVWLGATTANTASGTIGADATAQLIVASNGRFAMATGCTIVNSNNITSGAASGISIASNARISFLGNGTQISGTGNIFYADGTSTAEYLNAQIDGVVSSPTVVRNVTAQEIPAVMNGKLLVDLRVAAGSDNAIIGFEGSGYPPLPASVVLNGPVDLQSGGIRPSGTMNGSRVTVNGTMTFGTGGFIAGDNNPNMSSYTGAFAYGGTSPVTIRVTNSTLNVFNNFGVVGTGNVTLSGGTLIINGDGAGAAGVGGVNVNGQLYLPSTGNLILNSATLDFRGQQPANSTPGTAQGGHIPVTNTGAIQPDAASDINFRSRAIRSFLRFVGGSTLSNLRLRPFDNAGALANVTLAPNDYLVSLVSPITLANQLQIDGNSILQLRGVGSNLTTSFSIIGGTPGTAGNFIDASQGGNLIMNNVAGTYTFPIGASFVGAGGAAVASLYMPATITSGAGRQFTVSVTSAVTSVTVPSNLLNRSVQGMWSLAAVPSYTGNLTLGWNETAGAGIPAENAPADFHALYTTDQARTTIRRAFPTGGTPTTYVGIQSGVHTFTPAMFGAGAQTIQGAITSAIGTTAERFIVTNALFPIYWVGPTNDWATANNWAATPGGTGGSANPPGANDWAYFDRGTANITTGIPTSGVQRMTIARLPSSPSDPNVTLAQPAQTLNLVQRVATAPTAANPGWFEESLHIGTNASLTLSGTSVFMNPSPTVGGEERTVVFGRMQINSGSMFRSIANNMNNLIAFSSGATLQLAGGGFDRNTTPRLQYGTDAAPFLTPSLQPFYTLAPTTPAMVLSYTDATGANIAVTPTTSNEFSSRDQAQDNSALASPVQLDVKLVVNRTGANRDFRINNTATTRYRFIGGADLLSGNWELPLVQELAFGADVVDNRDIPYNAPITVAAGATFWGNDEPATQLFVEGRGASNLRFTDNNPYRRMLGALTVNIPSSAGTVTLNSSRNLTLIAPNGVRVLQGNGIQALTISPADTLTLAGPVGMGTGVTGALIGPAGPPFANVGVSVQGRLRLGSAASAAPHFATFNTNALTVNANDGITVAPAGVLEIFGGVLTQPPTISPIASNVTRPVTYQASTSVLRYATTGNVSTTDVEFPNIVNPNAPAGYSALSATLEIEKGFPQRPIYENLVQLNNDKSVIATSGTGGVHLLSGALDLSGGTGRTITINVPLISPSPLGMFRTTSATVAFNDSRIEYNNPTTVTLRFDASTAATYVATPATPIAIGSLSITGASVTLASGTNASLSGLTAGPLAGQLALNGAAQLTLNGNMLRFGAGNPAAVGTSGYITTNSNVIIGDANASLEFVSMRGSTLRMVGGTGGQLRNLTVNALGPISPTNIATTLVTMATSVSVQNELIMNAQSQLPTAGGGNIRLNNGIELFVNTTNANNTPTQTNAFIDATPGGRVRMPVAASAQRLFPVGVQTVPGSLMYSPIVIFNSPTASDYTVAADSVMDVLQPAYPQRVIPEWTVTGGSGNRTIRFYWETNHESTGFIRNNAFVGLAGGSVYQNFGATAPPALPFAINSTGQYYFVDNTIPFTSLSSSKLLVLNQPVAIILAADSTNVNNDGGLNSTTPNGFGTVGVRQIASGVPFTVRFSAFNGLIPAQRSPVIGALNVQVQLLPTPGSGDIFTTTGTGSPGTPITLMPIVNPISGTTTNITFNWTNAGLKGSTTAILRFYDPSGSITSATYLITIFGPASTLAASTIANIGTTLPGDISGFNVGGTPAGTTIESEKPFLLYAGSYNGLGQAAPVINPLTFVAQVLPIPGSSAVFTTTGTGSALIPFTLVPGVNPLNVTSTNLTVTWVNPGALLSTNAIFRLYDLAGQFASRDIAIIVNAPPLRASTIAYTQVQNSSNGTLGFNGGGLGQFNITGGVGIPINFGFFSNTNFLAATTNITSVVASIAVHPANPGSVFSTTPGGSNGAINPQTVALGATGGFIFPIFNWTNPPVNGGITKALITLTAPGLGSTTVTVTLSTSATAPVPTRLGYAVNSGDLLNAATGTLGFNGGSFGPGTPITSGQQVRVNFASFVDYGAVIRPTSPTQVQLSIAPDPINPTEVFTMDGTTATTVSQVDGTGSLFPRIFYTANTPGQRAAIVTLTAISGQTTLITTTAQVWITTTGSIATVTSFNSSVGPTTGHATPAIGSIGINGGNRNIPSGRPFNIDFGFFNAADVLATGAGNPMQLSIVSVTPATETVTIDGNSSLPLIFGARQATIPNVILNWRNPTVAGPITVVVRLTPQNLPPLYGVIASTDATITLSTGASIPVALAFSQISSTGTQGINGNSPNIANSIPFNVDLGLFDANGVLANSLSNSSVALTAQAVSGGNTFTVGGNSAGVFVNQSGIRLNGVTVTWTNPNAPTTQVRLIVSTTAGAGPIAATSAIVTISAAAVFPSITGFTPATGGPGTTVLISGSNFLGVNAVLFNGAAATNFTVLGDNLISVVVPAGASTGPVSVSRPPGATYPGGSGTSTAIFTVGTPPSISSFTPTSGGTGTILTITGSNFGAFTNLFTVNVAGVTGTVQSINAAGTEMTVLVSGTSLVPLIAPVTIATAGGVGTSAQLFTYNLAPSISSVTPNSAVVNGQDIPIIIRGLNFSINLNPAPTAIQSGVYFSLNNSPQSISPSSRISVQSVSATEIRATISGTFNNMVGQRFVTVLNADGQLANIPFQLVAGGTPTLTSITPSTTSASGVAFIATITGTNFFGSAGTTVTANGRALTVLSAISTQLRVIIPADLNQVPQTLTIVVRNSDNQTVQGTITISDPGRPVINSITPSRAIVGTSAVIVTIAGSGFFLNSDVTFNFLPIQVLANPPRSTNQITALIPASMLTNFGTFQIRVSNPGGFNGAALFNVGYPSPTITSVLTASGAVSGLNVTAASVFPFQLAITGTGFRKDLIVRFNGAQVPIVSTSDTQVIVQIAAGFNGTPGVFPITLANADGLQAESTFTIGQPNGPRITSVSPSTTNATGTPFVITVNGLNFGVTPQGQTLPGFQIRYNGTVLQILGASPTSVTAFVPAGVNSQEGNAVVQIINPDTQFAQASVTVLCSLCPIISSVSPGALRPQYNFDVTFTITGSNFQQGATLTLGGVPLRIVSIGSNQIIAVAPAGFFLGDPTLRIVNPDSRSFTIQAYMPGVREVQTVEVMSGSVYPNPMEDMVSFEANLPKAGQLRVRITDVLGNTVVLFTQAVGAGRFSQQLDVSALNTGVYFFEMTDGERRFTDKLIKR